jgi:hypothetical protein
MANPRGTVLGIAFSMLLLASIFTITREAQVSAAAWALLGLTAAFAAATVIAFFTAEENQIIDDSSKLDSANHLETEAQSLPDPIESGFDMPIL